MTQSAGGSAAQALQQHYLQVLARRTDVAQGRVQQILQGRLQQALQVQADAVAEVIQDLPQRLPPERPLQALTRHLAQQGVPVTDTLAATQHHTPAGTRQDLRAVQQARNTWSRLSADRLVAQALNQAPQNAGPINSHMLVLRSLALMRSLSPDYLGRFMAHVDALLCLEASDQERLALPRVAKAVKTVRVVKAMKGGKSA